MNHMLAHDFFHTPNANPADIASTMVKNIFMVSILSYFNQFVKKNVYKGDQVVK